ncbi:MAG: Crp/Fnr family transcriptional regulator [Clostridia bacterium]|nr:Crp/Fnr family transcriptional regulator [Clostridia bacterium]
MKKYYKILEKCPLFDNIESENLFKMLRCLGVKVESFDKKYTIMSEGSPARYIGIVLSGSAQIIQVDYFGFRSILSNIEPSQVFGEAFACAEIKSIPVTVVANEPCEVMLIDCSHILHTCSNNCGFHQQLIFNLMKDLAAKTISFHQKQEITSKRTTREKLMTYLSLQAKKEGCNRFQIPFNRQELADYLEVDRSGLSVEISKLRNEGVLYSKKNTFELLEKY